MSAVLTPQPVNPSLENGSNLELNLNQEKKDLELKSFPRRKQLSRKRSSRENNLALELERSRITAESWPMNQGL